MASIGNIRDNHILDKGQGIFSEAKTAAPQKKGAWTENKQSLVLIEEADVIFDDDIGFWAAVKTLSQQARRPILLTCNGR